MDSQMKEAFAQHKTLRTFLSELHFDKKLAEDILTENTVQMSQKVVTNSSSGVKNLYSRLTSSVDRTIARIGVTRVRSVNQEVFDNAMRFKVSSKGDFKTHPLFVEAEKALKNTIDKEKVLRQEVYSMFKKDLMADETKTYENNLKNFYAWSNSILSETRLISGDSSEVFKFSLTINEDNSLNDNNGQTYIDLYDIIVTAVYTNLLAIVNLGSIVIADLISIKQIKYANNLDIRPNGLFMNRFILSKGRITSPLLGQRSVRGLFDKVFKEMHDKHYLSEAILSALVVGAATLASVVLAVQIIKGLLFLIESLTNDVLTFANDLEVSVRVNAKLVEDVNPKAAEKQIEFAKTISKYKNWLYEKTVSDDVTPMQMDKSKTVNSFEREVQQKIESSINQRKATTSNLVTSSSSQGGISSYNSSFSM
jgi:hypothetical protein